MAATSATSHTFELLELILLECPITTIVLSTQVCHLWRETIETSSAIRRCLLSDQKYRDDGSIPLHLNPHIQSLGLNTDNSYLRTDATRGQLIIHKATNHIVILFAPLSGEPPLQTLHIRYVNASITRRRKPSPSRCEWKWLVNFCDRDGVLIARKNRQSHESDECLRRLLQEYPFDWLRGSLALRGGVIPKTAVVSPPTVESVTRDIEKLWLGF